MPQRTRFCAVGDRCFHRLGAALAVLEAPRWRGGTRPDLSEMVASGSPTKAIISWQWLSRPALVTTTLALLLIVFLFTILFSAKVPVYIVSPIRSSSSDPSLSVEEPNSAPLKHSPNVDRLIADLRAAVKKAEEGKPGPAFGAQHRKRWHLENPCRSRTELPTLYSRRRIKDVAPNPQWQEVLTEYTILHRTCTSRISNLTDFYLKGDILPGCKFITGESLFGLGNKVTFAASLVLYAVLTQRVILFPEWTSSIPITMCEPFEGSSWKLPRDLDFLAKRPRTLHSLNEMRTTNVSQDVLDWLDRERKEGRGWELDERYNYGEMDDGWHPLDRFWCDAEQEFASRMRWMSMAGCFYFIPKLFAIPMFRPTLEELFPDKMAQTNILRTVFLPFEAAWDRIRRVDSLYLDGAEMRVSIQVRYRGGIEEHTELSSQMNEHITRCLVDNDILPNISQTFSPDVLALTPNPPPVIKVLITSLFLDLYDHLTEMYLRHQTVTGDSVGVFQLTHDDYQRWGLEPDTEALVEIILLSLSDTILVTPLSTFGGLAQAYGGLRPYIIEHSNQHEGSCVRSDSSDVCYQQATTNYTCPYDPSLNGKEISGVVPYIQKCMRVDSVTGVHLITS